MINARYKDTKDSPPAQQKDTSAKPRKLDATERSKSKPRVQISDQVMVRQKEKRTD